MLPLGNTGSICGWRTKILHAAQCKKKVSQFSISQGDGTFFCLLYQCFFKLSLTNLCNRVAWECKPNCSKMTDLRRVHFAPFHVVISHCNFHIVNLPKYQVGCRSLGTISTTLTLLPWELAPLPVGAPLAILILNDKILLIRGDCIRANGN